MLASVQKGLTVASSVLMLAAHACPIPSVLNSVERSDAVVVTRVIRYQPAPTAQFSRAYRADLQVTETLKGTPPRIISVRPVATIETGPLTTGANIVLAPDSSQILFLKTPREEEEDYSPAGCQMIRLAPAPPRTRSPGTAPERTIAYVRHMVTIASLDDGKRLEAVRGLLTVSDDRIWGEAASYVKSHLIKAKAQEERKAALWRWLGGDSAPLRAVAMIALAQEPEAEGVLFEAAYGDDPFLADRAVKGLLRIEGERRLRVRKKLTTHPEVAVRAKAVHALGTVTAPRARATIVAFLDAAEPELRAAAVSALWWWIRQEQTEELAQSLQVLLDDPDRRVREAAVHLWHHQPIHKAPLQEIADMAREASIPLMSFLKLVSHAYVYKDEPAAVRAVERNLDLVIRGARRPEWTVAYPALKILRKNGSGQARDAQRSLAREHPCWRIREICNEDPPK